MASVPGGDPWRIPPEERAKHDAQFFSLKPINGIITGDQARGLFLQSGLPPVVLGKIWALSDLNADGKMNKQEFSIAMHLIKMKLQGYEVPKVLPSSLTAEFSFGGMAGTMGAMGMMTGGFAPTTSFGGAPLGGPPMHGMTNGGPAMMGGFGGGIPVAGFAAAQMKPSPQAAPAQPASGEWAVPQSSKLKYTQKFNMLDKSKKGYLTGLEAREILTQSNLTHNILAQIWNLADVDSDGKLTSEEFVLSMFLVDQARTGKVLPAKLTPDLVPPSYRRARAGSSGGVTAAVAAPQNMTSPPGQQMPAAAPVPIAPGPVPVPLQPAALYAGMAQKDAFGDLLGGYNVGSSTVPTETEAPLPLEPLLPVTFEDKRQENFMKGQAELERRRELLRQEQKKMEEERLAHERAEHERRERVRLEQERKKQQEMEKLLQKQRELEQEREEQRRKALEQREAARRELERQRQLEWERQRREQLMSEKLREQNVVDQMKSEVDKLKMELETLETKKGELAVKIESSRNGVTEYTNTIDGMRISRDEKIVDIENFQKEMMGWTEKLEVIQSERQEMDQQMQMQNSTTSDTYRTVMHSYNSKKQSIEKLKSQLETLEKDTAVKLEEIDKTNSMCKEINSQLSELTNKHQEMMSTLKGKKEEWNKMKRQRDGIPSPDTDEDKENRANGWGFDNAFTKAPSAKSQVDAWGQSNAFPTPTSTATTNGGDKWGDAFSSSKGDDFWNLGLATSSKSQAWSTAATGPSNASSNSLSSLDFAPSGTMSKNSSIDWDNPKMSANSLAGGKKEENGIGWPGQSSSSLPVEWGTNASTGPSPSLWENTPSTGGGEPASTGKSDSANTQDPFGDAGGSPPWPAEALSVTRPDPVDRSTSSEKELAGLWAEAAASQNDDSGPVLVTAAAPPTETESTPTEQDLFSFDSSATLLPALSEPKPDQGKATSNWADLLGSNNDMFAFGSSSATSQSRHSTSSPWADAFFTKTDDAFAAVPGAATYKAMFEFEARNPDELSVVPGDIVHVYPDKQDGAEPGWLSGCIGERSGWLPEAYVEKILDAAPVKTPSAPQTPVETLNKEPSPPTETSPLSNQNSVDQQAPLPEEDASQEANGLPMSMDSSFTAVAGTAPSPTPGQGQVAEEGMQAQALYPWRAKKDNHLTFNKGDVITVLEQQEMWWSGSLNDMVGWFPKSYVKVLGSSTAAADDIGANEIQPVEATTISASPAPEISDEGEFHVALYAYSSSEPGDLIFNQGDVIRITKKDGDWWTGELNNQTGIFPGNYVKKMETQVEQESRTETESPLNMPSANELTQPQQWSVGPIDGVTFEATPEATVEATQEATPGWVSFPDSEENLDTVDWGEPAPTNTEEVSSTSDPFTPVTVAEEEASSSNPEPVETEDQVPALRKVILRKPNVKSSKKPDIASVLAPYQATGPEQLSLMPGQLIQVRKRSQSGWWEGELQARGQKRKIGWFPANYVKLLGPSSARNTPDPQRSSLTSSPMISASPNLSDSGSRTETPQPPQPTCAPALEQVMAIFSYQAQNDDELTFHKGSVINVIVKEDADWWKGECNGVTGLFPSNYVSALSESLMDDQQQSQTGSSWRWSSHLAMSPTENKRQNHIQEMIDTEENYVKDMKAVNDAFMKPLLNEGAFSQDDIQRVFVNWKELIMCNTKLLKALRVRKKMTGDEQIIHMIGDILCEKLPHMTVYIRFCSCQLNAANLVQKKYENDNIFKEVHKKCVQHPLSKGMPLSSFLLKPMQRICKYPLLIEKILENTPPEHPDHQNLQDAMAKATEICQQVNEGVREKENSDRLEWIQNHVNCEGLPEKITFNSVTNCLGPRKFLYSGSLCKAKSGKELVGFLFNDFLLLAQPQKPLGNMNSVFSIDIRTNINFKMYRTPVFLNEVMVKKTAEGEAVDPTLFHLSHIDRVYSLKAVSATERDTWVKKIEEASKHYIETERKKRERAHSSRNEQKTNTVGRLLVVILEGCGMESRNDNNAKLSAGKGCGRLLVIVLEGCNLIASDMNGKSDPYCEVSMGVQEHRTKVINNTLNPKWNASMQFTIKDLQEDVLCITVYDRDLFTPNDFLGRTEVRIKDIVKETREKKGPITKRLALHEVDSGEVVVKLDLQIYDIS